MARAHFGLWRMCLQHFAAPLFGQIDIENDQGRTGSLFTVDAIYELYGLLSIGNHMEADRKFGCQDGFLDQEHVGLVILDNQDIRTIPSGFAAIRGA